MIPMAVEEKKKDPEDGCQEVGCAGGCLRNQSGSFEMEYWLSGRMYREFEVC